MPHDELDDLPVVSVTDQRAIDVIKRQIADALAIGIYGAILLAFGFVVGLVIGRFL